MGWLFLLFLPPRGGGEIRERGSSPPSDLEARLVGPSRRRRGFFLLGCQNEKRFFASASLQGPPSLLQCQKKDKGRGVKPCQPFPVGVGGGRGIG